MLLQLWVWEQLHVRWPDRMFSKIGAYQPTVGGDVAGHVSLDVDDAGFEDPFGRVQDDQTDPLRCKYVISSIDFI